MSRFYSIRPAPPDYVACTPYYGTELKTDDCYEAASKLPRSSTQENTYTIGGTGGHALQWGNTGGTGDFALPWSNTVGGCEVAIEVAGPSPGSSIVLPTNNLRPYINFVIGQCVGDDDGIGGYGTWGIENTIDYMNRVQSNPSENRGPWPTTSSFITFSVRSPGKPNQPGNYDPSIALRFLQTSNYRPPQPNFAGQSANPWYWARLKMTSDMNGNRARKTWWNVLMEALGPDEMEYTCNASLGSPTEVDCAKLEYSELGPSTDTVQISPDAPKVVTSGSCSVAVEASTPVSITWGQIATALATLLEVCMTLGAAGMMGGTAIWHQASAQMQAQAQALAHAWFEGDFTTLAGRQDVGDGSVLSGLNALPPSVNLTLFGRGHFNP